MYSYGTGRISFTSHSPGEHTICLFSNSTAWFSGQTLRVHLEMAAGEQAVNYAQVAQQERMSEIQLRIRQLLNQIDQIVKEQNYQRVSFLFSSFILISTKAYPFTSLLIALFVF